MAVREARTADVDAIARVHVDSARHAERGLLPDAVVDAPRVERRRRLWQRIIGDPAHPVHVYVAEDGPRLVGFSACAPVPDAEGVGELHAVYVEPAAQGHGHGSALLAAAEADLAGRGCAEAVAWVLDANAPTIAFYQAHGWADDGAERTDDVDGIAVCERRYRKRLRAVASDRPSRRGTG